MFVNARCMCTVFKIQLYSCARAQIDWIAFTREKRGSIAWHTDPDSNRHTDTNQHQTPPGSQHVVGSRVVSCSQMQHANCVVLVCATYKPPTMFRNTSCTSSEFYMCVSNTNTARTLKVNHSGKSNTTRWVKLDWSVFMFLQHTFEM